MPYTLKAMSMRPAMTLLTVLRTHLHIAAFAIQNPPVT